MKENFDACYQATKKCNLRCDKHVRFLASFPDILTLWTISVSVSVLLFSSSNFFSFLTKWKWLFREKRRKTLYSVICYEHSFRQMFALYMMKLIFLLCMYPPLYSRVRLTMLVYFHQDLKFWENHKSDCELLLNSNWKCVFLFLGLRFGPFSSPEKDRRFRKLPICKWVEFCIWVLCPSSQSE